MYKLIKKPSAWIPLAFSTATLAFIISYVTLFGIQKTGGDEGAPARIFQLLMGAQILAIAYFTFTWVPKVPKKALLILALQIIAALVPILFIQYLEG